MKTLVTFSLAVFFTAFFFNARAQFGHVVVFAPKGEKFSLFIGGNQKNNEPAARVEADNPGGPSFKIRIVFPDPSIKEISKLTFNKPNSTMYFKVAKNQKGVYVLESTTSEWMDDSNLAEVDHSAKPPVASTTPVTKDSKPEDNSKTEAAKSSTTKGCDNPISDGDFTPQLIDISARPFEPMQLSAAKKMAETHCLKASQVVLVIAVFDSESSRLSFAKFAYDHTHDQENYSDVRDALHSQSSKNDLDHYLSGKTK